MPEVVGWRPEDKPVDISRRAVSEALDKQYDRKMILSLSVGCGALDRDSKLRRTNLQEFTTGVVDFVSPVLPV